MLVVLPGWVQRLETKIEVSGPTIPHFVGINYVRLRSSTKINLKPVDIILSRLKLLRVRIKSVMHLNHDKTGRSLA